MLEVMGGDDGIDARLKVVNAIRKKLWVRDDVFVRDTGRLGLVVIADVESDVPKIRSQ